MSNPNTQLIGIINSLVSLAQSEAQLVAQINQISAQWTAMNLGASIANLTTMALNADGTAGANDGSPNSAHPISLNNPPNYALGRAMTGLQVTQVLGVLQAVAAAFAGQAVSANAGASAIIDVVIGN